MLTWQQYYEAKKDIEDKEEELHQDLDGDGEEGESEEHKEKVLGKNFGFCRKCKTSKKKCKC